MNDNDQTLTVENWDEFIEHNENALALLNGCASPIADMSANVSGVLAMYETDYLTTLNGFSMSIDGNTYRLGELPSLQPLVETLQLLTDEFSRHFTESIFTLETIEACINQYKGKDGLDGLIEKELDVKLKILKGIKTAGVFSALSLILNDKPHLLALSWLFKYGPKVGLDGVDKTVSREIASLFGKEMKELLTKELIGSAKIHTGVWVNATTGAVIVMAYDFVRGLIDDEGEMLPRDWQRLILKTGESGLLFVESAVLTSYFAAALGATKLASVAGPIAAVGAGVIVFISAWLFDGLIDSCTGDYVVDEIPDKVDIFGNPYVIYKNGTGKKGTYDVILEYLTDNNEKKSLDFNNKMEMYEDSYGYYKEGLSLEDEEMDSIYETNIVGDKYTYDTHEQDIIDILLYKIQNAKSMDEVNEIVEKTNNYCQSIIKAQHIDTDPIAFLTNQGFDFNEYYAYTHKDYAYIANNCNINESMVKAIEEGMMGVNSN